MTENAKEILKKKQVLFVPNGVFIIDNRGTVQDYKNSEQRFPHIYSESRRSQNFESSFT